jgi:GAF domain-containing protein
MTSEMLSSINTLEQRVAARTADLERRAVQMQVATDVGKAAASVRDLDSLLTQTAHLVSARFGFYHAGIFLLDEAGKFAVLRAASSEGGQRMLARGHRLEVGHVGIVGNVAQTNQARIALDVGDDAVYFDNPDLPETRSEMALPLAAGGRLLGVLDVQSTEAGAFTREDIFTLQIVADQLALAIESAHLLQESRSAAEAAQRAYGEIAAQGWRRLLQAEAGLGFRSTGRGNVVPLGGETWSPESNRAILETRPVLAADGATLSVPILLRGQPIGALRLVKANQAAWAENEIQMAQLLSDQLSGALDGARLYGDSQRRAERERAITEVSARIGGAVDIDHILRATAEELSKMIGDSEVVIQLAKN